MSDKTDKIVDRSVAVIGIVLTLWLFYYGRKHDSTTGGQANNNAPVYGGGGVASDPMAQDYMQSPGFAAQSPTYNVNIANQGLGYLDNKYLPLFGFVGMATG
jgi:hypothetical protein